MDIALVTTCTSRKKVPAQPDLEFGNMRTAHQRDLEVEWCEKLHNSDPICPAKDLYCGRGFAEAKAVSISKGYPLFIISAGLGLVRAGDEIPAYNATTSKSGNSSIPNQVDGGFSPGSWWSAVAKSKYSVGLLLHKVVAENPDLLFVVALSKPYLELVKDDLNELTEESRSQVRILGPRDEKLLPELLRECFMPYDERFDGPDNRNRGTRSDYCQRVARHFIEVIVPNSDRSDSAAHRRDVMKFMKPMAAPPIVSRNRMTDDDLLKAIRAEWDGCGGNVSRLLRFFRDEKLIACEQSRFSGLCRTVRKEKELQQ